jgi:hypothetical protein
VRGLFSTRAGIAAGGVRVRMSKRWPDEPHQCKTEGCQTRTFFVYCAVCDNRRDEARQVRKPPAWQREREEACKQAASQQVVRASDEKHE